MGAYIESKELPKAFGQEQPAYTELRNLKNKKDQASIKQELEKQKTGFLKMLLESLKHQDPEKPANVDSILQVTGMLTQIDAVYSLNDKMDELIEYNKSTAVGRASQFQGQEVYYDNGVKQYNATKGETVEFEYELKNSGNQQDIGEGIFLNVEILNSDNQVVFNTKTKNYAFGKGSFSWSGYDNSGNKVLPGEYRIKLEANKKIVNKSGQSELEQIEVSTYASGTVESVEMEGDKAKLRVNGKLIDPEKVQKMVRKHDKVELLNKENAPEDFIQCLGKNVTIDVSNVTIKDGKGYIHYSKSDADREKQEYIIEFAQVVNGISKPIGKPISYNGILGQGVGSFELKDTYRDYGIKDGVYGYSIKMVDKDTGKKLQLEKVKEVEVKLDGIDFASKQIISDNKKYNIKNILRAEDISSHDASLISKSGFYIGKQVAYANDQFVYSGEEKYNFSCKIPNVYGDDAELSKVKIVIYDGDKRVADIETDKVIYFSNQNKVPKYHEIHDDDKNLVDEYIGKSFGDKYDDLDKQNQATVNRYIEQQFRSGLLFRNDQVRGGFTAKRNMGIVDIEWNGNLIDGSNAENKRYRYEVVPVVQLNGVIEEKSAIFLGNLVSCVQETRVDNGDIHLILDNGLDLKTSEVTLIS